MNSTLQHGYSLLSEMASVRKFTQRSKPEGQHQLQEVERAPAQYDVNHTCQIKAKLRLCAVTQRVICKSVH